MKLYLIRHGETDWNAARKIQGNTDVPLNAQGVRQAQTLAARLKTGDYGITKVYTSGLARARRTAEIVAAALDVPCETVDGLHEVCFGAWEGGTWEHAEQSNPDEARRMTAGELTVCAPGGETYAAMLTRVLTALKRIAASEPGNVAVVTHGGVIRMLSFYLSGGCGRDFYVIGNATANAFDAEQILDAKLPEEGAGGR